CRGTLQSRRGGAQRLLLLFGERHSLKPFIRDTGLNVVDLDKLGGLSCVGVEGDTNNEIPGWEARQAFETMRAGHADEEKGVEGILGGIRGPDFYFWTALTLMRPELPVRSVHDPALCEAAGGAGWELWRNARRDVIRCRLQQSGLFEASGFNPTA